MSNYTLDSDESKVTDQYADTDPVTVTIPADYDEFYPPQLTEWDQWIPTSGSTGKQPDARDYSDLPNDPEECEEGEDSAWSWSNPANWTTHEHALDCRENGRYSNQHTGVAFIIQRQSDPYREPADPFVIIDLDDVVNKKYLFEDGERVGLEASIHPDAWEIVEQAGYGALSSSAMDPRESKCGVHVYVEGVLPGTVKSIGGDLPEHPDFPGASIEVYDLHVAKVTPYHIPGTAIDVRPAQDLIDDLADAFDTTHAGSPGINREPSKDEDEVSNIERTTDIQDVYDAIYHVDKSDIWLRSTKTGERSTKNGTYIEYDPSWRKSKSGTSLAWSPAGHWIDRDLMRGLDALHVVALEEGITTDESSSGYPSGSKFFEGIDALRNRGAEIPDLIRDYADLIVAQHDGFEVTKEDVDRVRKRDKKQRERREAYR